MTSGQSAGPFATSLEPSPSSGEGAVDVSIVIPCYRDEAGLERLLARLGPAMSGLGRNVELVLVDDGSPDRTAERATQLAAQFPFPTAVVRLAKNCGQHAAVIAGFAHCRGRAVVTMDSDLQYPPEQIQDLLAALSDDTPVVSGYREGRRDPLIRRVLSRALTSWLSRRTGVPLRDYGSMFRAYDRRVVEQLLRFTEHRRYLPALVGWLQVPVCEIPVAHEPRGDLGSRYHLAPLVDMFLDMITGYSTFPLRVMTVLGLAGAGLGFAGTTAFLIYRVFVGAGVSGLISAFALIFFLLGIQLLVLALLGEYVGRIYIESKARPFYVVDSVYTNR